MQNQNIETDVLLKLSEITLQDAKSIKMEMNLADDLGIDSLSIANLIGKFEKIVMAHPHIDQFMNFLSNAQTVGEFCDLLKNKSTG